MEWVLGIVVGLVVGGLGAGTAGWLMLRGQRAAAAARSAEEEQRRDAERAALLEQVKTTFAALSRDALAANNDFFLKLANDRFEQQSARAQDALDNKKKLIDARSEEITKRLTELHQSLQSSGKQTAELRGVLQQQTEVTHRLQESTALLREALAHPQRRGQWGERMAQDVLRLAGLVENVSYVRQQRSDAGTIPDFTFFLPNDQKINMDVKFPMANYLKVLDAGDEEAARAATGQFLRDVRSRVKEVTTRAYISPAEGTVDFVLVFIPNEQMYGFIHEHDPALMDDALERKVVLCSPLSLYAILGVIRQAAESARIEKASQQILTLLAAFRTQWSKYVEVMDRMGKRLEAATKEYNELVGVRTRQLDRQLDKISDLEAEEAKTADRASLLPTAESADPPRA